MTNNQAVSERAANVCREWMRGCSCAPARKPWECAHCTEAFHAALESTLGTSAEQDVKATEENRSNGCGATLAQGQYWSFCGETDMGQTLPALCTRCGGEYYRLPS